MRRVFVVLSQFTGDNLALNQVFGMTESFSFSAQTVINQEKRARPSSLSGSLFAEAKFYRIWISQICYLEALIKYL
jgi:hypothetical protein